MTVSTGGLVTLLFALLSIILIPVIVAALVLPVALIVFIILVMVRKNKAPAPDIEDRY